MTSRGKYINNLAIVAGLALNLVMLWGVLQFWPRGFKPSPMPDLGQPAPLHKVEATITPPPDRPLRTVARPIAQPIVASPAALAETAKSIPETRMIDGPHKIVRSVGPGQERVTIDGENYVVTPPWLGHSLPQVIDPRHPGLVMLPREMAFEERKIYVTTDTRQAFLKMAEAAALDGVRLQVDSGYRSAGYQRAIYRKRLAEGTDFTEISKSVAPPGYSEHMLGCTLDLVPSNWSFKDTPADRWLRDNAGRFSFVQSYPANNPLGFAWEPWHWKYVGDDAIVSRQATLLKDHKS